MARNTSPEIDDELFNEVYGKAYTGPPGLTSGAPEKTVTNKRSLSVERSDEEDEPRDPNAVPTDFTSREAKFWEAKAKATERNWKKRKEEEMICKICGEAGHFTQGCPSTLGASRKSADFFERVPARDTRVRSLFTGKVISQIEKDVGCKIKMDEKFMFVSGKDRLILAKGVDAVHKVIQEGDKDKGKGSSSSLRLRSKSPDGGHVASEIRRSESQRSHSSPRSSSHIQRKNIRQERIAENQTRAELQKFSNSSPQAYRDDGARHRPMLSKSPPQSTFPGNTDNSHDFQSRNSGRHRTESWGAERHGSNAPLGRNIDFTLFPQNLEELEMEFKKEAMEYGRVRDKEEDDENYRHRECMHDLRENYAKRLADMREMHAKQWENFLHIDMQRHQRYNAYNRHGYTDYDRPSGKPEYAGSNLPVDTMSRYPYPSENYSSLRPNELHSEFQPQRNEEFSNTYARY